MPFYTNRFRGRANRKQKARHLRDEFDRIEAAFAAIEASQSTVFNQIYIYEGGVSNIIRIVPANGLVQEVTVAEGDVIEIENPTLGQNETDSRRIVLLVHGANVKFVNGWGPQTWKERGPADWNWLFTGHGPYASALLELVWDGGAWVCVAFTNNRDIPFGSSEVTYPMIGNLLDADGANALTLARSSFAIGIDTDSNYMLTPPDMARFIGARYPLNWIASASDLQSVAWEANLAALSDSVAGGPAGEDVDKITWAAVGGDVVTYMLPDFGRALRTSDNMKGVLSFKARMDTESVGSIRVKCSIAGGTAAKQTINLTDEWQNFAAFFDLATDLNDTGAYVLNVIPKRTLTKVGFESPSGSLGSPVRITDVQFEFFHEGAAELPSELQDSSIGASMTLAATSGSTGTWDNGTKAMTLDSGEYVDFQDSLVPGATYLCVLARTSGESVDVLMREDQLFWQAYRNGLQDVAFVADGPFTFRYSGGPFKLRLTDGASSAYTVNIYPVSGNISAKVFENASRVNGLTKVLTYDNGPPIAADLVLGLAAEPIAGTNLVDNSRYRNFRNWTRRNSAFAYNGEYGIDGLPSRACTLEDRRTDRQAYFEYTATIPDDSNAHSLTLYVRKTYDQNGVQQVFPQYSSTQGLPSQFMDIELAYIGGTTELGTVDRLRVGLIDETYAANGNSDYDTAYRIDLGDWWMFVIKMTNNSSGNDTARIRIYPASANDLDSSGKSNGSTGWVIVDWAQLESGVASSPILGGETRAADVITTGLDDGFLYSPAGTQIGSVTSGSWDYDANGVYRSTRWLAADPSVVDASNMHEFGPPGATASVCEDTVGTLDDQDEDPILAEDGSQICLQDVIGDGFLSDSYMLFISNNKLMHMQVSYGEAYTELLDTAQPGYFSSTGIAVSDGQYILAQGNGSGDASIWSWDGSQLVEEVTNAAVFGVNEVSLFSTIRTPGVYMLGVGGFVPKAGSWSSTGISAATNRDFVGHSHESIMDFRRGADSGKPLYGDLYVYLPAYNSATRTESFTISAGGPSAPISFAHMTYSNNTGRAGWDRDSGHMVVGSSSGTGRFEYGQVDPETGILSSWSTVTISGFPAVIRAMAIQNGVILAVPVVSTVVYSVSVSGVTGTILDSFDLASLGGGSQIYTLVTDPYTNRTLAADLNNSVAWILEVDSQTGEIFASRLTNSSPDVRYPLLHGEYHFLPAQLEVTP